MAPHNEGLNSLPIAQDVKFIRRWIDALKSGKYKKGVDRLRCGDNKFCCLGVAADLKYPNEWVFLDDSFLMKNSPTFFSLGDRGLVNDLIELNDSNATWDPVISRLKDHIKTIHPYANRR